MVVVSSLSHEGSGHAPEQEVSQACVRMRCRACMSAIVHACRHLCLRVHTLLQRGQDGAIRLHTTAACERGTIRTCKDMQGVQRAWMMAQRNMRRYHGVWGSPRNVGDTEECVAPALSGWEESTSPSLRATYHSHVLGA